MKSLLKNLGLILMIIGAAILVGVFFTGSAAINDNGVLGGSAALNRYRFNRLYCIKQTHC